MELAEDMGLRWDMEGTTPPHHSVQNIRKCAGTQQHPHPLQQTGPVCRNLPPATTCKWYSPSPPPEHQTCSYSRPCLATFAWRPWTHPLGSTFFHFHQVASLWYVSELITGDKHRGEVRQKRPCSQVFWHQQHMFGDSDPCFPTSHTPVLQHHQCSTLISFQGKIHCA